MLPSMIQQITAASLPRPAERANTRKLRQENILMMMLGRNLTALDLSRHYKKSLSMIANDLREMIDDEYVFAFSPSGEGYRSRMYSLTKPGVERAKRLKEMSE